MNKFTDVISNRMTEIERFLKPTIEGVDSSDMKLESPLHGQSSEIDKHVTHIQKLRDQRDVIEQWEKGYHEKNLMFPLIQWTLGNRTESLKLKIHDRKLIAV